jgi:hypothetical protein
MHRSFGTADFYWPKRIDSKEPFDLLWFRRDFAVMFFLTSSQRAVADFSSLRSLIHHNVKQFRGMEELWITGGNKWRIRGENGQKLKLDVEYKTVKTLLVLSVVNVDAGVVFHEVRANQDRMVVIATIPERFIDMITSIHGTVVDIVALLCDYAAVAPKGFCPEQGAQVLQAVWQAYRQASHTVQIAGLQTRVMRRSISKTFRHLASRRTASGSKTVMKNEKTQKMLSIVADLTAGDYKQAAFALAHAWEQWWAFGKTGFVEFSKGPYDFLFALIQDPEVEFDTLKAYKKCLEGAEGQGRGALASCYLLWPGMNQWFHLWASAAHGGVEPRPGSLQRDGLFRKLAASAVDLIDDQTRRLAMSHEDALR